MSRILVVDDEKWIRSGLIKTILELNQFDAIDEASNGNEALEKARLANYDIVLTDIKMPDINGLDLIMELQKINKKTRFIIISGYAEFEYAQKALLLGVDSYLLKPVSDKDIVSIIQKMMEAISHHERNEAVYDTNLSLKNNIAELSMEKKLNEIFQSNKIVEEVGSCFFNNHFACLATIYVNPYSLDGSMFFESDVHLVKYAVENILNDIVLNYAVKGENCFIFQNFQNTQNLFTLIVDENSLLLKNNVEAIMSQLYSETLQNLKIDLRIAVSSVQEKITKELYMQCKKANYLRFLESDCRIYFYQYENHDAHIKWYSHVSLLQNGIELRDTTKLRVALNRLFSEELFREIGIDKIEDIYLSVVHTVSAVFSKMKIPFNQFFFTGIENLEAFDRLQQLNDYIYSVIVTALGLEKEYDADTAIQWIKRYVDENLAKEIIMSELAEHLHFHPGYFSTLFKKATGKTFIKYVTDARVQKACQLLLQTDYSNQEIAALVGYRDGQYFYKVFKSVVGMTPLEYRTKNTNTMLFMIN